MAALCRVGQERPRRFARLGRAMAFISAATLLLAVGACFRDFDVERASFSRWEVNTKDEPRIIFYDIGTPLRGEVFSERSVRVKDISVEVLSWLQPETAVLSGSGGRCAASYCYFKKATLFVSSQAEADAWSRYFAELGEGGEKKMREKWGPKKIQPPPILQKND